MTLDGQLKVFCCMITPFDEHGDLDEAAIAVHVDRVAAAGVGLSLGTASPGEGHSLSPEETERFWGLVLEQTAGRVPVIGMGCEPRSAKEFRTLIRIAESVGLESMQLYSVDYGHGNLPTEKELERYFRTLLEDMSIPARLSSHKAGGYNIPLPVIERLLGDYPSIVGIHCISDNTQYLRSVNDLAEGQAEVLTGGLHDVLMNLSFGGQGYLDSTCALLVPQTCRAIIDGFAAGKLEAMNEAFSQAYAVSMVNRWTGPRTVKEAARVVGLPGWHLRPPYLPLEEHERRWVADTLAAAACPELDGLPWGPGRVYEGDKEP